MRAARAAGRWLPLATAALLAGCDHSVAPQATAWEGSLAAEGGPATGVTGTVAAVADGRITRASIQVQGREGTSYEWRIRRGGCDDPGELVGGRASYPTLVAGTSGTASADAALSELLSAGGVYHAAVLSAPDTTLRVACGALEQR